MSDIKELEGKAYSVLGKLKGPQKENGAKKLTKALCEILISMDDGTLKERLKAWIIEEIRRT